jgi:hypothetical protein
MDSDVALKEAIEAVRSMGISKPGQRMVVSSPKIACPSNKNYKNFAQTIKNTAQVPFL